MTAPNPLVSPRGTFARIATSLRKQIETGQITTVLPSEAELVREFGVSRTTIRRALKALADEGAATSVPGVGWRVGRSDSKPLAERVLTEFDGKAVGDDFPSERHLCEKYQASRPLIRSVLANLQGSGLLTTHPGKGRQVAALPTRDERPST
ncbi:GntR family transcriptional regulator [Pseudofrankia asymbiotica]|uniref:GntR family transcriptional regulator n=1 Tax=Pseudofrankia asymbiotica TaxID=1834516 RepID=UPI001F525FC9|nr:GntR family transcriptional regulator [Pseudofrankia asymbiotica]